MDIFTKEKRSAIMSRVRSANTSPEIRVRRILHQLGYRFRLHRRDLPGTPDIVLPAHHSVILVHGCFWHRHDGCSDASMPNTRIGFWKEKFTENVNRDAKKTAALLALGWKVLIVWECELRNEGVLAERLQRVLSQRGPHRKKAVQSNL
jgi:DNA mismatch endonuclease (patch repair protein)